jgi:hypothetical protein
MGQVHLHHLYHTALVPAQALCYTPHTATQSLTTLKYHNRHECPVNHNTYTVQAPSGFQPLRENVPSGRHTAWHHNDHADAEVLGKHLAPIPKKHLALEYKYQSPTWPSEM